MTNKIEYFAEGVQSFFDANMPSSGSPTTRSGCRIVQCGVVTALFLERSCFRGTPGCTPS